MLIALSVSDKEKAKGKASAYFQALRAAGAAETEIELVSAADGAEARRKHYDGVLFSGGEDVDPSFYGEAKQHANVHENRDRDEFELALLDAALASRNPILGICRGI